MLQQSNRLVTLDEYRRQMQQARLNTEPGCVYFDGSPVGTGKSFLNAQHVQQFDSSRTLVKTHVAASETLANYQDAGVENVKTFPKLSCENCKLFRDASRAQVLGLNVGLAICSTGCPFYHRCEYRRAIHEAEAAPHQILCHDRGRVRPASLDSAELIIVEEDATDLLFPKFDATEGFDVVRCLASRAMMDTSKPELRTALERIEQTAADYDRLLAKQSECVALELPQPIQKPNGLEDLLFKNLPLQLSGYALKITLGTVFGDWEKAVFSNDREKNRKTGTTYNKPRIIVTGRTKMPKQAEIWITDATGWYTQLSTIFPKVENRTPQVKPILQHKIEQIPIDVCKSSKVSFVSGLLKRILQTYCKNERVGLITHKEFIPSKLDLTEEERKQITVFGWFGGNSRGTNDFYEHCTKLVVLGTPRPPTYAVRARAMQLGFADQVIHPQYDYISQDGLWRRYTWNGETSDGRKAGVIAWHYRKDGWQKAYESLVLSELTQSAGRARGLLESGIDTILVTVEQIGAYPLLELPPRNRTQQKIFECVCSGICTVPEIADAIRKSERTVRRQVSELLARGELWRESERGKLFVAPPAPTASEC